MSVAKARLAAAPVAAVGLATMSAVGVVIVVTSVLSSDPDLPFSLRMLNTAEEVLVGMGQAPASCSDLSLYRIARVMVYLFQAFYQFLRILHLFRSEVPKHWRYPLFQVSAHTIPHSLPLITIQPQERSLGDILK